MSVFDFRAGMRFRVAYEDIEPTLEINRGERITESAGYRTAQQQIEELLIAGQRLDAHRRGDLFYDFEAGDYEDDFEEDLPVTRMRGFEMAHASQLDMALRDKFRSLEEEPTEPITQLDVNRLSDTNEESSENSEVQE